MLVPQRESFLTRRVSLGNEAGEQPSWFLFETSYSISSVPCRPAIVFGLSCPRWAVEMAIYSLTGYACSPFGAEPPHEDQIGVPFLIDLPGFEDGFERFRTKAADSLKEHQDHPTVRKLRWNEPLGSSDLDSLEALLSSASFGTPNNIRQAKLVSEGLGLFVRSLVGLDRSAVKAAFSDFLDGRPATANQIEFINMIVDHLTEQGWMDPALLYASPFID